MGKLLIDTDAGADDAIAILMALHAEEVNGGATVVGITCVNGNTYVDNVALNVLKTLKVVDRLDVGEKMIQFNSMKRKKKSLGLSHDDLATAISNRFNETSSIDVRYFFRSRFPSIKVRINRC